MRTVTRRSVALTAAGVGLPLVRRGDGFASETTRPLVGAYAGAGCTGVPRIQAFEEWLGLRVDLVVDFADYRRGWKVMGEQTEWLLNCWGASRRLVLAVPMLVEAAGPVSLRQGAAGEYDAHLRGLVNVLARSGTRDPIIRLGWEFNGTGFPWTAHADPGAFNAYWRRIVGIFRQTAPRMHALFDWSVSLGSGPAENGYPGDDVVDVIGLDTYNQFWPMIYDPWRRWQHLLDDPTGLRWHRDFAAARGKPRSFPEWGTGSREDGHGGGDDPLFIRNMLDWFHSDGPPVAYHGYWNDRSPEYDSMVTDGRLPLAAAALRAGLHAR